ncbi:MAG: restriction endonuclease subunit S [Lachnospiraceae bacterium]|nr:restriction endonuclease subunit S [Lachnospiraceae bacterium]
MKLGECLNIRTGLPLSRKIADSEKATHTYTALSLKAFNDDGTINLEVAEPFCTTEPLKPEYFTRVGDVLIRLSAPYTAAVITEEYQNLLVSQHFSILRCTDGMINPQFLRWWLSNNRKRFYKSASGSTFLGTISTGYIGDLEFSPPSLEKQQAVGELLELAAREKELLLQLSVSKEKLINAIVIQISASIGGNQHDH